ncbi:helix-turn-helix domain-containing protein [Clostridium sporogenes]|uniref:helix-turn-helix domain-containing protein n=2 Tax=Clostridium sporogenes TaxID=1509 RepID=UPI001F1B4F8A|nr:helix-turn-helix transcriptional regulator [Clostridium sporogenes]EKS4344806.1 helix-turn-helix transcriptional regulator [Clostridium botulinum]EKS4395279.1 helix-turn-helix transcriptional regulator [Clostridium botulinum]UJA30901.1 helix-turn-helix transcriptional regulator [Clostridium sporogenes]
MEISELGLNIKKFREQKGWSLSKLKQESGVGYATLHDIENGKSKKMNSKNLEKVAKALNITTNELLGIDIVEYTVTDLEETLKIILQSDELEIDGLPVTENEKEELEDFFSLAVNSIKRRRKKE